MNFFQRLLRELRNYKSLTKTEKRDLHIKLAVISVIFAVFIVLLVVGLVLLFRRKPTVSHKGKIQEKLSEDSVSSEKDDAGGKRDANQRGLGRTDGLTEVPNKEEEGKDVDGEGEETSQSSAKKGKQTKIPKASKKSPATGHKLPDTANQNADEPKVDTEEKKLTAEEWSAKKNGLLGDLASFLSKKTPDGEVKELLTGIISKIVTERAKFDGEDTADDNPFKFKIDKSTSVLAIQKEFPKALVEHGDILTFVKVPTTPFDLNILSLPYKGDDKPTCPNNGFPCGDNYDELVKHLIDIFASYYGSDVALNALLAQHAAAPDQLRLALIENFVAVFKTPNPAKTSGENLLSASVWLLPLIAEANKLEVKEISDALSAHLNLDSNYNKTFYSSLTYLRFVLLCKTDAATATSQLPANPPFAVPDDKLQQLKDASLSLAAQKDALETVMKKVVFKRLIPMPTEDELDGLAIVNPNPPRADLTLKAVIDNATLAIRAFISHAHKDKTVKRHAFKDIREIFVKGLGLTPTLDKVVNHRKRLVQQSIVLLNRMEGDPWEAVFMGTVLLTPLLSIATDADLVQAATLLEKYAPQFATHQLVQWLKFYRTDLLSIGNFPDSSGKVQTVQVNYGFIKDESFVTSEDAVKERLKNKHPLLYDMHHGVFSNLVKLDITSANIRSAVKNLVHNADDAILKGKPKPPQVTVPPASVPFAEPGDNACTPAHPFKGDFLRMDYFFQSLLENLEEQVCLRAKYERSCYFLQQASQKNDLQEIVHDLLSAAKYMAELAKDNDEAVDLASLILIPVTFNGRYKNRQAAVDFVIQKGTNSLINRQLVDIASFYKFRVICEMGEAEANHFLEIENDYDGVSSVKRKEVVSETNRTLFGESNDKSMVRLMFDEYKNYKELKGNFAVTVATIMDRYAATSNPEVVKSIKDRKAQLTNFYETNILPASKKDDKKVALRLSGLYVELDKQIKDGMLGSVDVKFADLANQKKPADVLSFCLQVTEKLAKCKGQESLLAAALAFLPVLAASKPPVLNYGDYMGELFGNNFQKPFAFSHFLALFQHYLFNGSKDSAGYVLKDLKSKKELVSFNTPYGYEKIDSQAQQLIPLLLDGQSLGLSLHPDIPLVIRKLLSAYTRASSIANNYEKTFALLPTK